MSVTDLFIFLLQELNPVLFWAMPNAINSMNILRVHSEKAHESSTNRNQCGITMRQFVKKQLTSYILNKWGRNWVSVICAGANLYFIVTNSSEE